MRDDDREEGETLELRGCPFCGAAPRAAPRSGAKDPSDTIVYCDGDECHVGPQVSGVTPRLAQSRWNARAAQVRLHRVRVTK